MVSGPISFIIDENWQYTPIISFSERMEEAINENSSLYQVYKKLNYQCRDCKIFYVYNNTERLLFTKDILDSISFKTVISDDHNSSFNEETGRNIPFVKTLEMR
jgi:hypothetical protein